MNPAQLHLSQGSRLEEQLVSSSVNLKLERQFIRDIQRLEQDKKRLLKELAQSKLEHQQLSAELQTLRGLHSMQLSNKTHLAQRSLSPDRFQSNFAKKGLTPEPGRNQSTHSMILRSSVQATYKRRIPQYGGFVRRKIYFNL